MTNLGRSLVLVVICLLAGAAATQESLGPKLTVIFDETETIPGQPLSLRVKVLVPTWMTKPVVFPSLEGSDLMVRLPSRATTPLSERIGGDTWSGVSRHFRIMPMVPGRFTIPPQEVIVTWADPDTNQPRRDVLGMDGVSLTGVLPDVAKGLDPFIAAEEITLSQTVSGTMAPLRPGDSITRTVTARIKGTPPMFLPRLLALEPVEGIAQYPAEPILSEKTQRGAITGTRIETVTYLAQSGGDGTAGSVTLDWFNLRTGKVETASVDGFLLTVDAPLAHKPSDVSLWDLGLAGAAMLALVLIALFAGRPLWARWSQVWAARHRRYLASASWARKQVHQAVRQRDLDGALRALDIWAKRVPQNDPRNDPSLNAALTALGAARYGHGSASEEDAWQQMEAALRALSKTGSEKQQKQTLPPLNPAFTR
jgi:hypothetical protein